MRVDSVLTPAPDVRVGDSVAVVGNSGQLLGSELGEEIDDHDSVFRFNAAPVEGFEEDVGAEVTARILNAITQKGSTCNGTDQVGLDALRQTFSGDGLICKKSNDEVFSAAHENYADVAEWMSRIDKKAYVLVRKKVSASVGRRARVSRLSMGALWSVVMTECAETVDLYGFGFHEEPDEHIHYWEDVEKDITAHHNYALEKEIITDLDRRGELSWIRHEQ